MAFLDLNNFTKVYNNVIQANFAAILDGTRSFTVLVVDNITIDGNTISSTSGAINLTPVGGSAVVIDAIWSFDGNTIQGLTAVNLTILATAGQNVSIESVTFDGGVVAGVTTLTTSGALIAGDLSSIGSARNAGFSADYTLQVGTADGAGTTSGGILIRAQSTSGISKIAFDDGATADGRGRLWYSHSTDAFTVYTAGVLALTISSAQVITFTAGVTGITTLHTTGVIDTDDTTDSTSGTTGSIQTDGGIGCVKNIVISTGDLIITTATTPATAGATGQVGTVAWDVDYIYICTATNAWERVAIATW